MEEKKDEDTSDSGSSDDSNSLETTNIETSSADDIKIKTPNKKTGSKIRGLISHVNIYLLVFILVVVLTAGFTFVGIISNRKTNNPSQIKTQKLSTEELSKLSGTDASVGDAKQTLTIASNAIFSGKVLIRDSLDIAGGLKIGGVLNIPGITVAGTATFDQIQANKLTVASDTNIQGQLTALKGITVTGGGSFGGPISAPQITVQNFQLSGDLQLQRHIDAGGATPSKTNGSGLGGGGTVSVSGTDTAGTVTINFGGGASSGNVCYVTINFVQNFNATPHVVISPASQSASQLNYYTSRTNSNFQVCSSGGTASGSAIFDYIVVD